MNCSVCNKPSQQQCSACHRVSYCSPEHQKQDWKKHKQSCCPYIVKRNDKYGRYLVASRDISPGTIIVNEPCIMIGPKQESLPICLGCHKKFKCSDDSIYYCSNCPFPLCGPECEKIPIHAENECKVFPKDKSPFKITSVLIRHSVYECIFTLRCLLLKNNDPNKWDKLNQMEHQNEMRIKFTELWNRNQINTVDFLKKYTTFAQEFSDEEIHSVIGYADINSFEIKLPNVEACGLFDKCYLLAHECTSNTHHSITENLSMIFHASVPIKKGDLITTAYAHTLDGTIQRRLSLRESKLFECDCKRCKDPSELGTFMSAVSCFTCRKGYLLPINSLDDNSDWLCRNSKCKKTEKVSTVQGIVDLVKADLDELKSQENKNLVNALENIVSKYSEKVLHPNHFWIINVLHSLSQMYGKIKGWGIDDLSMKELQRKQEICIHLLQVVAVIEPGLSRIRGITLYELQASKYYIAKRLYEMDEIDAEQLKLQLEEVIALLREAQLILSFDYPNSREGMIASTIPESIDGVKGVIEHFCFK